MRALYLFILFLASTASYSQTYPRDTITNNGGINNRINYVYMGDGYQPSEMSTFHADVININDKLFQTSPFKEYRNYFNVFTVRVPSGASGARHAGIAPDCPAPSVHPVTSPSNSFGSRFDVSNIHRLVVPDSFAKIYYVLTMSAPFWDQMMLVVNSEFYGGSGGQIATTTKHLSSAEIAIHELGHSFGGLADEYWAGPQYANERPNMTAQSNPSTVRWKNWVGTNNVGLFVHQGGPGWFRPTQGSKCKMESLGVPFCSVCKDAIVEKIHSMVTPIDSYTPVATSIPNPSSNLGFKVNLVRPEPNTLKVTWKLDGNVIGVNTDTVTVSSSSVATGNHLVSVTVTDTTSLTRNDGHLSSHTYNVNWNISSATGILDPEMVKVQLKAFPNPFTSGLNIEYQLEKKADVKIELVDLNGRVVVAKQFKKQAAGKHATSLNTKDKVLSDGLYFLVFTVDGNRIVEEKIKLEQ